MAENLITLNNSIYDDITNYPYFDPEQMIDLGVYDNRYYKTKSDNNYLAEGISTKKWFDNYCLYSKGLITEEKDKLEELRIQKLAELYYDYDKILDSNDDEKINARKQSILELGWNPEVNFSLGNRINTNNIQKERFKSRIRESVDLTDESMINILNEGKIKISNNCNPLFIFLSYTDSAFGKIILKATHAKYSHSAISLDSSLKNLFSFNLNTKKYNNEGFSLENIDDYIKRNKESTMCLYVAFINDDQLRTIKTKIDDLLYNIDKTKYSFLTGLGTVLNMPIVKNNAMICSQFVDTILKLVNLDITKKKSALVVPNDFYNTNDKRIYKLYEGKMVNYKKEKIDEKINKFIKNKTSVNEAKTLPVSFDNDGNLLIKNMKKLNYQKEYEKSHRLLLNYDKAENYNGMIYELAKLYFLNSELEKKIYVSNIEPEDKEEYYKIRSRVLNDFNKYLKIVLVNKKDFNFTEYYNSTPFSDASIKIDKYTLMYTTNLIKNII